VTRLVPKPPNNVLSVLAIVTPTETCWRKTAPTVVAASVETVHVGLEPEHAPVQLPKDHPALGLALRMTDPEGKSAVHVAPQLIPGGLLDTLPDPVLVTVRVCSVVARQVRVTTPLAS